MVRHYHSRRRHQSRDTTLDESGLKVETALGAPARHIARRDHSKGRGRTGPRRGLRLRRRRWGPSAQGLVGVAGAVAVHDEALGHGLPLLGRARGSRPIGHRAQSRKGLIRARHCLGLPLHPRGASLQSKGGKEGQRRRCQDRRRPPRAFGSRSLYHPAPPLPSPPPHRPTPRWPTPRWPMVIVQRNIMTYKPQRHPRIGHGGQLRHHAAVSSPKRP